MASGTEPINPWPGVGVAAGVAALILGTIAVVFWSAAGTSTLGPPDWAAVRFTLSQALASALLSVVLAIPVARALARRTFVGRRVLITLLGAPFLLPVIVAVMGLLAIFGRSGVASSLLSWAGMPTLSIYGYHGVVLAHVFLNFPLATRLILQGWMAIPAERFRLAAHLNFSARDMRMHLERPMLLRAIPGAFAIIFAICLSSFAVALTMGGGPKATTVELAIYQAFRFDFDLGKAAVLGLVQLALAGVAATLALWAHQSKDVFGRGLDRLPIRYDAKSAPAIALDFCVISAASLFLLSPLLAVFARGLTEIPHLPFQVWTATFLSIQVAIASAALALCMSIAIACAAVKFAWVEGVGILAIAASPLVIGTGLFIVLFPIASPQDWAITVTACVNAVLALPFVLRALVPAVADAARNYGRLAQAVGMGPWAMLRYVIIPRIRAPLGFAAGLTAALSMGDLGVVALFASVDQATLPLQIYRLMGAYQMQAASGAAVLLAGLSFAFFWVFDAWGRHGN